MEMNYFDKQFVERTKNIVETLCKDDYEHDVSLLLNCLLGLVSLPTERSKYTDIKFKATCVAKLQSMGVIVSSTDDNKTFRTLKNAISHMYIEPLNDHGEIQSIIFEDRENRDQPAHTKLKFTVTQLKEFALFVADKHLERIANKKKRHQ